jgi:hypothetical protein
MFERFIREVTERQQPMLLAEYGPPGEAEALADIQTLCWLAGIRVQNGGDADQYENQRYEKLRLRAVRLADSLTDDYYRSAAIHFFIDFFMKTNDVELARVLFRHVKVDIIRDKIIVAYPQLCAPED